jgi:hypothetical protein
MVYTHIMPRMIFDFKEVSNGFEGPNGEDVEMATPMMEILLRFNKIN